MCCTRQIRNGISDGDDGEDMYGARWRDGNGDVVVIEEIKVRLAVCGVCDY